MGQSQLSAMRASPPCNAAKIVQLCRNPAVIQMTAHRELIFSSNILFIFTHFSGKIFRLYEYPAEKRKLRYTLALHGKKALIA